MVADPEFHIDAATGLLRAVRQVLSPHRDARPAGQPPELVVVHGISLPPGEFGGPWIDRVATEGDRDAIAFPKSATGADPLTGAPSSVDEHQVRERHLVSTAPAPETTASDEPTAE